MARRRHHVRRKGDLVWVTIGFDFLADDTLTGNGVELLSSTDWQPTLGVAFDRATVMGMRGWIGWMAVTAGTLADRSYLGVCIYKQASNFGAFVLPTDPTSIASTDILRMTGAPLQTTPSSAQNFLQKEEVNIKSRRKIGSDDSLYIAANITPDTVAPTVAIVGILRTLVKTS